MFGLFRLLQDFRVSFVRWREKLREQLDKAFCRAFHTYPSFPSAYQIIKPHFLRLFFYFCFLPFFGFLLYVYFCVYRYFDSPEMDDPEFIFCLYGEKVDTFVDLFYQLYRHSEVSCYYANSFIEDLALFTFFEFISNPCYRDLMAWTLNDFVFETPVEVYNRFKAHIKDTPIPLLPAYPIVDSIIHRITGSFNHWLPYLNSPYHDYMRIWLAEWIEDVIITIIILPYYIWIDRRDYWLYPAWERGMQANLYSKARLWFRIFYYDETMDYFRGWFAFIPEISLVPESIATFFGLVFAVAFGMLKVVLSTIVDVRFVVIQLAKCTDYISLYSSPFWYYFSSFLTVVYGVPFFIFCYIVLHLSLFFVPLRVIVIENTLDFFYGVYRVLYPFFTLLERSFSANKSDAEAAHAVLLYNISELWMLAGPLMYIIVVFYLFFLLVIFIFWIFYKPVFFAYALVYDYNAERFRSSFEIRSIVLTQLDLFRRICYLKACLLYEFVHFIKFSTAVVFILAIKEDSQYQKELEDIHAPTMKRFREQIKELQDWETRDRMACEEKSYEEHGDMILEDDARLAAKNLEHADFHVWGSRGTAPEYTTPYPYISKFVRTTLRFFGFIWPFVGLYGLYHRRDYLRLFMDGITSNVILPFLVSEDSTPIDTPVIIGRKEDVYQWLDRYDSRWVPIYGGDMVYEPSDITTQTYTYATTILAAHSWFFFGFLVAVAAMGIAWVSLRSVREVVNAYWTAAFFSVVYGIVMIFGDSFGFGLLDYGLPLSGYLDNLFQYLDGWGADVGLTDNYHEFKNYALDNYYSYRRYKRFRLVGEGLKRRRKRMWKLFLLFILHHCYLVIHFYETRKVNDAWDYSKTVERFLSWINSNPIRVTYDKYKYPVVSPLHDAVTSVILCVRLWGIKIRKRLGGGGGGSDPE